MNCQDFESIVRDLERAEARDRKVDPLLSAADRERAFAHVDACGACALKLQDERALNRGLAALVTEMKSLEPAARIEAELLDAFRQVARTTRGSAGMLAALPTHGNGGQDARAPRRSYWLAAAAAVVLLVFGAALLRSKLLLPSPEPGAGPTVDAKVPAPDSAPVPGAVADGSSSPESNPRKVSSAKDNHELAVRQVRSRLRESARRPSSRNGNADLTASEATPATTENQNEPEIATQFIALSYAGPASLQDGGQIVRVELPRSAMASLGLPVNMDRFGERVKADVLVSADGFARAIRFVQ